jgi:ABC-type dipeptide/oligopeptide/nickel transport system ATPase component
LSEKIKGNKMIDGFNEYLDCIKADYIKWQGPTPSETQKTMAQDFCDGLTFEVGSRYIKVITGRAGSGRSVHSFVCLRDMGKFTKGDILKAAGWAGPARNFARGNTMARTFQNVRWTGAM